MDTESASGSGFGPHSRPARTDYATGSLAHLRGDDHAAVQTVTFGLSGGAGVEFLTWWREADHDDCHAEAVDDLPDALDYLTENHVSA